MLMGVLRVVTPTPCIGLLQSDSGKQCRQWDIHRLSGVHVPSHPDSPVVDIDIGS